MNLDTECQYTVGDFISQGTFTPSVGIVRSVLSQNKIEVRYFNRGELPFDETIFNAKILTEVLNPEEGLLCLKDIHAQFEKEIEKRKLLGAIAARKQYHLDQLLENLKKGMPVADALNQAHLEPSTGVYVVAGKYAKGGICLQEDYLLGIVINHERKIPSENDAISFINTLETLFPRDFSCIPKKIGSGDHLIGYHAFEIPPRSLQMVERMKTLTLQLR